MNRAKLKRDGRRWGRYVTHCIRSCRTGQVHAGGASLRRVIVHSFVHHDGGAYKYVRRQGRQL